MEPKMVPNCVVSLFVREGENGREVLAISRTDEPENLGLVGGKIEPGETPEAAMIRETREEVGVEVLRSEFIFERLDPHDKTGEWIAWCYRVDAYDGTPRTCEKGKTVVWVPYQKLLEPQCVFRAYNRQLFHHLGWVEELPEDSESFAPSIEIPLMDKAALKKFVLDFVDGRIFTDKHIRPNDQAHLMGSIFMPIAFGALANYNRDSLMQIGCIYETIDKAGPRSINGYPMFFSCSFVHKDDWERARQAILAEEKRRAEIEV